VYNFSDLHPGLKYMFPPSRATTLLLKGSAKLAERNIKNEQIKMFFENTCCNQLIFNKNLALFF